MSVCPKCSFLSDTSLGSERLDYGEDNFPPLDYISYDFLTNMKRSGDKSKQVFEALMQIADAVLPQVWPLVLISHSRVERYPSH